MIEKTIRNLVKSNNKLGQIKKENRNRIETVKSAIRFMKAVIKVIYCNDYNQYE